MFKYYLNQFFENFIKKNVQDFPLYIYNLPQSSWSFFISSLFWVGLINKKLYNTAESNQIVFIFPDSLIAKQIYEEANFFLNKEYLYLFIEPDGIPYEWSAHDLTITGNRIRTLNAIIQNLPGIIFTTIRSITKKIVPIEYSQNYQFTLRVEQKTNINEILETLIGYGYTNVTKVENKAEFSLKGEILDIYPIHLDYPVRIDFFDNYIESIRFFHPENQKSIEKIEEVVILPASEFVINREQYLKLKKILLDFPENLRKPDWLFEDSKDSYKILNSRECIGLSDLIGFSIELKTIWDYFKIEPLCIVALEEQISKQYEILINEYQTLYNNYKNEKISLPPEKLIDTDNKFIKINNKIFIHHLHNLNEKKEINYIVQNTLCDSQKFRGKITEFRNLIRELQQNKNLVFITSYYDIQLDRIETFLKNEQIKYKRIQTPNETWDSENYQIFLIESPLNKGFTYVEENLYFFTDSDLFGKTYSKKFKYNTKYISPLDSYLDLKEGDYVVHINHGIGKFLRLERIKAAGIERDCFVIEYADKDILYLPLDQISLIQRYLSPEENPRLDHLGKSSFKKIKEKVEKNVEKFAKELLEIYAARLELRGYAFPPDTELQEEFESEFPYEETPDQIRAIEEVKKDMESPRPMDRLICGDVGYGKTEVAIRAIFKCVLAGKQAAVICPTTILARQHYINFKERFKSYPIKIDWISGLRTQQEINKTKKKLKNKEIDVIIGTHALLSKNLDIPELGLLVIDEEQKFGVLHKEQLKKLKKHVDVLTLTATPIPRTLHMSLIGIRDLSIINTPPKERKPVETYVLEDSDAILKEAILKELNRGGQVFFLHNRIKTIESIAERIRSLIPDIRIAILHSKIHEEDKDNILNDFIDKKYDLLLTTSIIENGIDMPNVNTLIVDEADKFGLSQLYQLRGRVGRSDKQAYAYFLHNGIKTLTEEAQKRLNTLLEYQELGSGFKIAMRDLEIRGAGNILGKEQSGDIIEVGYELYLKMLENTIKKLKGEQIEEPVPCYTHFKFNYYLSENYIKDTRQRIEFYKKLESTTTIEQFNDIINELMDRFGEPDEQSKIFLLIEEIRALGSQLGIESISENNGTIQIQPSKKFKVPIDKMLEIINKQKTFYLKPGNTKYIFLDTLRLQYLRNKNLKYSDISIQTTKEDLIYLKEKLKELMEIANKNLVFK